ncbi:hypothetical protein KY289_005019 [Solanum tuberosum]|nr:hypothetical protein KY289_005019 [Solanum tuberosum]
MEPFQDRQGLKDYRRRLGMQHAVANSNRKIWDFMDEHNQSAGMDVMVSLVYAKCTQIDRLILWEFMSDLASTINLPWMVGGDFNVICNEKEKLGGRPVTEAEVRDFNYCINVCNLEDRGFKGSKYTWWNGRLEEECIFKRLDRVLGDEKLQDDFSDIRSGAQEEVIRPFRFLNFWIKEESFMKVVKHHWRADFEGDPFMIFHHKLTRIKKALTQWSKTTCGRLFIVCQ